VEQLFQHHDSESGTSYSIVPVAVPFCPPCSAIHRRERRVLSPLAIIGTMFRSHVMWGAAGHFALAALFLSKGISPGAMIGGGFFLLLGALCARFAYSETRHHRVSPPTSVSSAFSIGLDISSMFEPERRTYTLRNPQFAEAFVAVNRDRLWDPASPHAQRAAAKRSWAIAVLIVLAAAVVVWGIYKDYIAED
jgi:hypothetical protein